MAVHTYEYLIISDERRCQCYWMIQLLEYAQFLDIVYVGMDFHGSDTDIRICLQIDIYNNMILLFLILYIFIRETEGAARGGIDTHYRLVPISTT